VVDVLKAELPPRNYDLIVISEVLEHLEEPSLALRKLARILRPQGRVFINVPINSPSPDHIYLLTRPQEVRDLIEASGLMIESIELFPTQAKSVEKALANKISISAGVVARHPPANSC